MSALRELAALALSAAPGTAPAGGPTLAGIPIEFFLFGLTLLGVALFHAHTLKVALSGLVAIALFKILFSGFKSGPGVLGFASHLGHEWVTLANLFGLLMGFALLSRHFEKSHVPVILPKYLPDDWKGAFVMLVMVFVLSSFLDNIAAALIGGAMAHQLFRAKVHIGYLAAIVAASNAGGAGSVVGDTTTTMLWIAGASPVQVLDAYVASFGALVISGIPASMWQHKHSPILKDAHAHTHVDWKRIFIVGTMLVFAIVTNVIINVRFPAAADHFPFIGVAVWVALVLTVKVRRHDWEVLPETFKGSLFLLSLVVCASMMPVESLPVGVLADHAGPRIPLRGVRQHPAHRARHQAGRLRLGNAGLRGGLRRLHGLVRLVGGRGALQHVPGGQVGGEVGPPRLAGHHRLRGRLRPHPVHHGVAPTAPGAGRPGACPSSGRIMR